MRGVFWGHLRLEAGIGLAQFGREASTLGDLLSAADQALYSAKARGGNRVELAPDEGLVTVAQL